MEWIGDDNEWEFDQEHFARCRDHLAVGDELVWRERDERFDEPWVKKTLRRGPDFITFLVQDVHDKVLTVGTLNLTDAEMKSG